VGGRDSDRRSRLAPRWVRLGRGNRLGRSGGSGVLGQDLGGSGVLGQDLGGSRRLRQDLGSSRQLGQDFGGSGVLRGGRVLRQEPEN